MFLTFTFSVDQYFLKLTCKQAPKTLWGTSDSDTTSRGDFVVAILKRNNSQNHLRPDQKPSGTNCTLWIVNCMWTILGTEWAWHYESEEKFTALTPQSRQRRRIRCLKTVREQSWLWFSEEWKKIGNMIFRKVGGVSLYLPARSF